MFIDGSKISCVSVTKSLGIIIDSNLSWKFYINEVASTISRNVGIIYKLKNCFPRHILNSAYTTLVLPHLNYCAIVWTSTYPSIVNSLFVIQKRAARFILNVCYISNTFNPFTELRMLSISDIQKYQLGIFMYKYNNNLLPLNFKNYFILIDDVYNYNTRSKGKLYHNTAKSSIYQNTVRTNGPKFWNNLIAKIRTLSSLNSFKEHLKIIY